MSLGNPRKDRLGRLSVVQRIVVTRGHDIKVVKFSYVWSLNNFCCEEMGESRKAPLSQRQNQMVREGCYREKDPGFPQRTEELPRDLVSNGVGGYPVS
ncbi:hypothetical protein EYF80_055298 [Liparis tanakae]|uniref:Uncharacterized protein n=1 Tax=Liparis tanakae TaxID=230148 RepID=A0A4Z2F0I5_9TELE|nr:hypothetical protein EYF80_055298 [Liparis tanakae]